MICDRAALGRDSIRKSEQENLVKQSMKIMLAAVSALSILVASPAWARSYISIVGSSTVYPFATVVAERFGLNSPYPAPKVEATGTGAGIQLFCSGVGLDTPDIVNASRPMSQAELKRCHKNGVRNVVEVMIGYDGIILAQSDKAEPIKLSLRELYLGLARWVPAPDGSHKLVKNPYENWSQINDSLPDREIRVLGPPATSGTREAFLELGIQVGCRTFDWLKALEHKNPQRYKKACLRLREDGHFVAVGENDNLIVQKLTESPVSLGIFGYSFLAQNRSKVDAIAVNGLKPTFENIASHQYPLARSLYMYVKKAHVGVVPGIRAYLKEFTRESTWGPNGYLRTRGLIPAPEDVRAKQRRIARKLIPMRKVES